MSILRRALTLGTPIKSEYFDDKQHITNAKITDQGIDIGLSDAKRSECTAHITCVEASQLITHIKNKFRSVDDNYKRIMDFANKIKEMNEFLTKLSTDVYKNPTYLTKDKAGLCTYKSMIDNLESKASKYKKTEKQKPLDVNIKCRVKIKNEGDLRDALITKIYPVQNTFDIKGDKFSYNSVKIEKLCISDESGKKVPGCNIKGGAKAEILKITDMESNDVDNNICAA